MVEKQKMLNWQTVIRLIELNRHKINKLFSQK